MFLTRLVLRVNLSRLTKTSLERNYVCFNVIKRKFSSENSSINLSDSKVQNYLRSLMFEYNALRLKNKLDQNDRSRLFELDPIVKILEDRMFLQENLDNLKDMKSEKDEDMKALIKEELNIYGSKLKQLDKHLLWNLLESESDLNGGVVLEVSSGAGGQEAMLFARELFQMYEFYSQWRGWEVAIASFERSDIGGVRKASMLIDGVGVPDRMRIEAGVHRVQRIPATERGGRIHTSTVSVAVLPQATEVDLQIPDRDLQIETKRASGAGGQHVNTTDSAVRIIHIPTGTVVECQEGRSQIKNRQIAMQKLRALLLQKQNAENDSQIKAERRSQVGSGERNEKIRTYNYPQDRVTEHRPGGGTVHGIKIIMAGGAELAKLQDGVIKQMRLQKLINEINSTVLIKEDSK